MSKDVRRKWRTREIQISTANNGGFSIQSKGLFGRFWDRIYKFFFKNITPAKKILFWYALFSFVGALLLWAPFAQNIGDISGYNEFGQAIYVEQIEFIDAFFMSASAFSDTGLSTVTVSQQFNVFGQVVLFFLILVGGIGWFTIKLFLLSFVVRKGLSWRSRRSLSAESGASMNVAIGTAKVAAVVTILSVIVFGLTMGMMFYYIEPGSAGTTHQIAGDWGVSMWTGFFMANSAINNAGLDIIGSNSLAPYYFAHGFQWVMLFLFVLGGIGFGIIYDIKEWVKHKHLGRSFRFSLLTKVSTVTYLSVSTLGVGFAFMFEGINWMHNGEQSFFGAVYQPGVIGPGQPTNPFTEVDYGTMGDRVMAVFFNTMSTRNAGFSTIDLNVLSTGTITTYNIMMFIGSGPGSTAGGIRTTTLFVMLAALWQYIRGKKETTAFNRRIPSEDVRSAFVLTFTSLGVILAATLAITAIENGNPTKQYWTFIPPGTLAPGSPEQWMTYQSDASFVDNLFTVFSAYGTTGLSTMSLANVTDGTKSILIILMFLGQLGMLNFLKAFTNTEGKRASDKASMISESIAIG